MRKIISAIALMLILAMGAVAAFGTAEAESSEIYTDPERLYELIGSEDTPYLLLDVRTPAEYAAGYIPTAENIPVDQIGENPPEVARDSLIILYCRSGNRSNTARQILENLGYSQVVDFGGIYRWEHELHYK